MPFATYSTANITFPDFVTGFSFQEDQLAVVAEWLRRLTRNQIPSGSVGSNPTDCAEESFAVYCQASMDFSRPFLDFPRWPQQLA